MQEYVKGERERKTTSCVHDIIFIANIYKLHSEEGDNLIATSTIQSANAFNNDKHFWPMKIRSPCVWPTGACLYESGSSATPVGVSDADPPEVLRLTLIISPRPSHLRQNPTRLRIFWVMELDKMDENDWKYHGEGNKSIVVSHLQVSVQ